FLLHVGIGGLGIILGFHAGEEGAFLFGDAEALAGSWRTYTELRQEEMRLDSLLTLSRLPRDRFYERIRELETELQGDPEDPSGERESIRSPERVLEPTGVSTDMEGSGFLNERNPVQMERGRELFRQVWGDRPLADDWRRAEAIRIQPPVVESFSDTDGEGRAVNSDGNRGIAERTHAASGGLNLDEIPATEQEQLDMEIEQYEILYRIGVHYLVRLDEPERAREHFLRVWQEAPEGAPRRESLYALADLAIAREEMEEAYRWADTLIEFDPASPHARQLASRLDLPDPAPDRPDPSREMENGFVPVPIEWNLLRPGSGLPPVLPDSSSGSDAGRVPE
ncbi:MAG: tetratricopeptide repeat protein, partial [Bacteroidota bacterium]